MTQNSPFGFPQFDPSKMDPKVLMQLSQLIQQLPPAHLSRMQTLMHNMMAGMDVRREMEEFEKSLPPGFKEKIAVLMGGQMGSPFATAPDTIEVPSASYSEKDASEMNIREARLTVLRAVADGKMQPEEAERVLFTA
jgi:hypothetical protein